MTPAARRLLRAAVIPAVLAFAYVMAVADEGAAARPDNAAATRSGPRAQAKAAARETVHVELERMNRPPAAAKADAAAEPAGETVAAPAPADVVNAFSSTSWYVPPPPPKAEPPPKPTAPPLPFTYMGRYEDAGRAAVVVMLVKGDRLYTVSVGDVIDGTYRVDRISDKAVDLIYLPLHEKQALPAGGA